MRGLGRGGRSGFGGRERRNPAAGSSAHPQLAALVSDQRIGGVSGHRLAGQRNRVAEQLVVPQREQVRDAQIGAGRDEPAVRMVSLPQPPTPPPPPPPLTLSPRPAPPPQ